MALIQHILVTGNTLTFGGHSYQCAIGKGGFSSNKQEGDGATPIGTYPLRMCWYRKDKLPAPETSLSLRITDKKDGWCDDPKSSDYNQPIVKPYDYSHESMWRDDDVYDLVIPLGYNDDPIIAGKGSAIFMHLARDNYEPTEGCVALAKEHLLELLRVCGPNTVIEIRES